MLTRTFRTCVLVVFGAATFTACSDMGDPLTIPDIGELPVIEGIVPSRTVAGDTLWITGTGFGSTPAGLSVEFASGGGRVAAAILEWTDTEVMVEVPQGSTSGVVTVTDGSRSTDGIEFDVAPRLISFRGDLNGNNGTVGILSNAGYGCSGCHFDRPTGISGFSVGSPADIRAGGQRGSGAVPRHPEESRLIRVMRGTDPVVPRMPDPGNVHVSEEDIQVAEDWIYQGMRDN